MRPIASVLSPSSSTFTAAVKSNASACVCRSQLVLETLKLTHVLFYSHARLRFRPCSSNWNFRKLSRCMTTCDWHVLENHSCCKVASCCFSVIRRFFSNVTTTLLREWEIFAHSPCYPDLAPCYLLSFYRQGIH